MEEVNVAIITPYLAKDIDEFVESMNPLKFDRQVAKFGYNPLKNFGKISQIQNERNLVRIVKQPERIERPEIVACMRNPDILFSVMGSSEDAERDVMNTRGSGALIARYSIFYGGNSKYTGRNPSDAGYAFDIQKDPEIVREMLQDDDVLDAISQREESKIKEALESLNKRLTAPILVTSYLEQALRER